jgi:hypothetical protein
VSGDCGKVWLTICGRSTLGRDSAKVLAIRAESTKLNPLLPRSEIDDALEADREAALADYFSEWRDDLASWLPRDLIEATVDHGVTVRPYDPQHRYVSFIDASSGQQDSFTCAICHKEDDDIVILDNLTEVRAPFSTAAATAHIAATLKAYFLNDTMGDDHAKGWVIEEFARHGIAFKSRPPKMDRSALYQETAPLFTAGRARLLDSAHLVSQFCSLERRLMPNGWSRIDHPARSGHHDDLSNACAGALWRATTEKAPMLWDMNQVRQIQALGPYRGHGGGMAARHNYQVGERAGLQIMRQRGRY